MATMALEDLRYYTCGPHLKLAQFTELPPIMASGKFNGINFHDNLSKHGLTGTATILRVARAPNLSI